MIADLNDARFMEEQKERWTWTCFFLYDFSVKMIHKHLHDDEEAPIDITISINLQELAKLNFLAFTRYLLLRPAF